VILVGADKGGVGKTTLARTLLDYLAARNTPARAFDSEFPRGALKRFHPKMTEIIDLETAADQIKVIELVWVSSDGGTVSGACMDGRCSQIFTAICPRALLPSRVAFFVHAPADGRLPSG